MTTTDVLVVGAGPTGLMMANLLDRSGVKFRVMDKKSGPTEETRALVVHAKTLELFDKLGLAERAVEQGKRVGAAEVLKEGKGVGELSFFEDDGQDDRAPYPFALIYEQHRTERLLIQGLEEAGGRIEWSAELLDLIQTSDGATATIRHSDGSEEIIEAGWVVGADGASSPVRHFLNLDFEGDTYEENLFLADVNIEWDKEPERAYMDLTREGFIAFFPMPGDGRRFRLTGALIPELAEKQEITHDDVQRIVDADPNLKARILETRWTSVYRIHRRMTERFRVNRVFLAGDAAHVHSPAGGQGMNTGIGDAYNLAWKLALVVKGRAHDSLLDSYEAERMPFARSILNGSDRGFSLQVTNNPVTRRLKLFAVPLLFRLVSAVPLLRRRVFWFISQLWTSYRESPVVEESRSAKKGPRAGERAPYGFFEAGKNAGKGIFEVLKGPDHHLLLFEGTRSEPNRLEVAREEIDGLLERYEAPMQIHQIPANNKKLHERYGVKKPRLFLIRPDGHVAYSGEASDVVGLKVYLDRLFTEREARKQAQTDS